MITNEEALKRANETVEAIKESTDRFIVHRDSRPVYDLKQMFETSCEQFGDNTAFMQRFEKGQPYENISYARALKEVRALGTALISLGLGGKRIGLIGDNCYQWATAYLSVTGGVGIIVPFDKELSENELGQLAKESEVSAVLFTSKHENCYINIKQNCPMLEYLINLNGSPAEGVLSRNELIDKGSALLAEGDRSYLDAQIDPDAMGVLLFTSGTTGIAKGVMLSQRNICENLMAAPTILQVTEQDVFFSMLPLHHTYECTCGFLMPIYKGAAIAYCEGLKYIQKNLKEVNPTIFNSVPLVFESLYKAIWKNIRKQGKEESVVKVMKLCKKLGSAGLSLQRKLLKDIYAVFGTRMKNLIAGGAPMDPEILEFFNDLGFNGVQGYGLTECSPMVALNPDDHKLFKTKSVGHLLPGMEVKIDAADADGVGEICFKGPNVMLGYYNMPEQTAKVLKDGWFYTGDLGYVDKDNFIYITGRAKNVIITANGKNVYPEELENYLSKQPLVAESMVWADKDDSGHDTVIVATVIPDKSVVEEIGGAEYSRELALDLLQKAVDDINDDLPIFKQIRRVVLREEEFEKTTGKKIKRFVESNKNGL